MDTIEDLDELLTGVSAQDFLTECEKYPLLLSQPQGSKDLKTFTESLESLMPLVASLSG